jgi:hypothetical protein
VRTVQDRSVRYADLAVTAGRLTLFAPPGVPGRKSAELLLLAAYTTGKTIVDESSASTASPLDASATD